MFSFDISFQKELARTTWGFYSVGISIIALRMYAQVHRLGLKGLRADDYLMFLAAGLYTALVVCLNVTATGGGSNLFEPEEFEGFDEEEIKARIQGSKIVIISEQAMLNVIYVLKTCILILYGRITSGLRYRKFLKYLCIYIFCGWLATEITFFAACRPFSGYWAVPPPDPQCTIYEHYAIVQACFNISSDIMMLAIPLPMIMSLQLPVKQKIVLAVVFSMGIFVIAAAILTKVFNLSNVYDTAYMLWYIREASVAVYVANLPLIWPLLREWFPCLRTSTSTPGASEMRQLSRSGPGGTHDVSTPSQPGAQPKRATIVEGGGQNVTVLTLDGLSQGTADGDLSFWKEGGGGGGGGGGGTSAASSTPSDEENVSSLLPASASVSGAASVAASDEGTALTQAPVDPDVLERCKSPLHMSPVYPEATRAGVSSLGGGKPTGINWSADVVTIPQRAASRRSYQEPGDHQLRAVGAGARGGECHRSTSTASQKSATSMSLFGMRGIRAETTIEVEEEEVVAESERERDLERERKEKLRSKNGLGDSEDGATSTAAPRPPKYRFLSSERGFEFDMGGRREVKIQGPIGVADGARGGGSKLLDGQKKF